jgi:hypothetical protein
LFGLQGLGDAPSHQQRPNLKKSDCARKQSDRDIPPLPKIALPLNSEGGKRSPEKSRGRTSRFTACAVLHNEGACKTSPARMELK